jgi:hypothetical protein
VGGGHRHQECPEKDNSATICKCCNFESRHPSSYSKERTATKKAAQCAPLATSLPKLFIQANLTPAAAANSVLQTCDDHRHMDATELARKMPGDDAVNHHSAAEHDWSTDGRNLKRTDLISL